MKLKNNVNRIRTKRNSSLLLKLNKKVDGLNDLVKEKLIGLEEPTQGDPKI